MGAGSAIPGAKLFFIGRVGVTRHGLPAVRFGCCAGGWPLSAGDGIFGLFGANWTGVLFFRRKGATGAELVWSTWPGIKRV